MTQSEPMINGVHPGEAAESLFSFSLDDRTLAVPLAMVIRAFFSVEVTPLPSSPDIVIGVISYHGTIVPVVDLRAKFGIASQEILPSDRFILIRTRRRLLTIVASEVSGVLKPSYAVTPVEDILPGARHISGMLPHEDQLILIHDPDLFLSLEEETSLDTVLAGAGEVQ